MSQLLLAIAALCQNNSLYNTNLYDHLACETEIIKCVLRRDQINDNYVVARLEIEVLECVGERKRQ